MHSANGASNAGGHSGESQMPSVVDGINGVASTYDYPEVTPDGPYRVLDQYHSKPRKLRVACVGAGASGLCLAYKMGKMLEAGTWELTLFDKNQQFGGTWLENTYPGVACDIPVSSTTVARTDTSELILNSLITILSHSTQRLIGHICKPPNGISTLDLEP